jgi:hypothetical protein
MKNIVLPWGACTARTLTPNSATTNHVNDTRYKMVHRAEISIPLILKIITNPFWGSQTNFSLLDNECPFVSTKSHRRPIHLIGQIDTLDSTLTVVSDHRITALTQFQFQFPNNRTLKSAITKSPSSWRVDKNIVPNQRVVGSNPGEDTAWYS